MIQLKTLCVLIIFLSLVACDKGQKSITYNGNGNTDGAVPVDIAKYEFRQTVTVLGNTGNLVKDGYSFAGWSTSPRGKINTYTEGQTFKMGYLDITLYAKWDDKSIDNGTNQACALKNCFFSLIGCTLDPACNEQLKCIAECDDIKDDQDAYNRCTLRCNLLYDTPLRKYDRAIGCIMENGCAPKMPQNCSVITHPEKLYDDVTPGKLEGKWYNVRGYNRGTDCFDCSYSTFSAAAYSEESRKTQWTVDFLMDDLGMRYLAGELEVGGPAHPGVAVFTYDFIGTHFTEYYNIIYYSGTLGNEIVVFVGCGGSDTVLSSVGYSIGMVLAKHPYEDLPDDVIQNVNQALLDLGLSPPLERMNVSDWCQNKYSSCN